MAAITPKLKMRCIRLQPAVGGSREVVDLLEKRETATTNTNLHGSGNPGAVNAEMKLVIGNAVAQGAFKIGQAYKVEFTEIAGDVTQPPSSD